jgi:hypothetical protein
MAWVANPSPAKWNALNDLIRGKLARYCYFPEFRTIPDLMLDLERVQSIPFVELKQFRRVASLVRPYYDALLARHSQFRGRIGVPELNSEVVRQRLSDKAAGPAS